MKKRYEVAGALSCLTKAERQELDSFIVSYVFPGVILEEDEWLSIHPHDSEQYMVFCFMYGKERLAREKPLLPALVRATGCRYAEALPIIRKIFGE